MPKKPLFNNSKSGKQGTLTGFFGAKPKKDTKKLPTQKKSSTASTDSNKYNRGFTNNNKPHVKHATGFVKASSLPFKAPSRVPSKKTQKNKSNAPFRKPSTIPRTNVSTSSTSSSSHKPSTFKPSTFGLQPQPIPKNIELPTVIVGRQHHPHLPTTFSNLTILRDNNNQYDYNAVLIIDASVSPPQAMGHLPRRIATFIAPLIDTGMLDLTTTPPQFHLPATTTTEQLEQESNTTLEGILSFSLSPFAINNKSSKVTKALSNLRTAITKQNKSSLKAAAKLDAKRKRTQGPQQQTIGQTFSRTAAKKVAPTIKSATLIKKVPREVLQHALIIGNLTPHDMCAVRSVSVAWKEMIDEPTFMRFTLASYRAINTMDNQLFDTQFDQQQGFPTTMKELLIWIANEWSKRIHESDQMSAQEGYKLLSAATSGNVQVLKDVEDLVVYFQLNKTKGRKEKTQANTFSSSSSTSSSSTTTTKSSTTTISSKINGWTIVAVGLLCVLHGRQRHALLSIWMSGTHRGTVREFVSALICVVKSPIFLNVKNASSIHNPHSLLRAPFFRLHVELRSALESGGRTILFPSPHRPAGTSTPLTDEQLSIVRCRLKKTDVVKVAAFAGSGKTTTLVELARAHPSKRFLYLAFNVSVRDHAQRIFPSNTKAKGIHQLAFAKVGRMYAKSLIPSLQADSLMRAYSDQLSNAPEICQAVVDTLESYCCSADRYVGTNHVPGYVSTSNSNMNMNVDVNSSSSSSSSSSTITASSSSSSSSSIIDASSFPSDDDIHSCLASFGVTNKLSIDVLHAEHIVRLSSIVWKSMCLTSVDSCMPMSHNGYLKLYQLRKPKLDIDYDVILLDEAQDTNPAIQDIVMRQKCARVVVGDRHQAIYSFIGAEDTLRKVQATRTLTLTKSFRFGHEIANVANALLRSFTDEKRVLIGRGRQIGNVEHLYGSEWGQRWWDWEEKDRLIDDHQENQENEQNEVSLSPRYDINEDPTKCRNVQSYAILARTNSTIFQVACNLMQINRPFLCISGVQGYGFADVLDTAYVLNGDVKKVTNPFLKRFKTGTSLQTYATKTSNQEIISRIKIIMSMGGPETVVHLCKRLIEKSKQHEANYGNMTSIHHRMNLVHLGTVHKAKGLEFNNVMLADDFVDLNDGELREKVKRQMRGFVDEFNIVYVAVTRAKRRLRVGPSLRGFLNLTGMLNDIHVSLATQAEISDQKQRVCMACQCRISIEPNNLMVTLVTMSGEGFARGFCQGCLNNQVPQYCETVEKNTESMELVPTTPVANASTHGGDEEMNNTWQSPEVEIDF